jgi:hypothetical protein
VPCERWLCLRVIGGRTACLRLGTQFPLVQWKGNTMRNKAPAIQSIPEMTENRAKWCPLSGHCPSLHARCRDLCGLLVLLIVIAGCGGGGGYNPNNVTVNVSPAVATVAENGQVPLQATVNGLCSTCAPSIYLWYISENGASNGGICDWYNTPPTVSCPAGTIQETAGPLSDTLTVTYYAPSTPGTYHVIAEWFDSGFFGSASTTKTGTAVITVSP